MLQRYKNFTKQKNFSIITTKICSRHGVFEHFYFQCINLHINKKRCQLLKIDIFPYYKLALFAYFIATIFCIERSAA